MIRRWPYLFVFDVSVLSGIRPLVEEFRMFEEKFCARLEPAVVVLDRHREDLAEVVSNFLLSLRRRRCGTNKLELFLSSFTV
jgi:hypothetical protein